MWGPLRGKAVVELPRAPQESPEESFGDGGGALPPRSAPSRAEGEAHGEAEGDPAEASLARGPVCDNTMGGGVPLSMLCWPGRPPP